MYLRCTTWCFTICIHCEIVTINMLINKSITSHSLNFQIQNSSLHKDGKFKPKEVLKIVIPIEWAALEYTELYNSRSFQAKAKHPIVWDGSEVDVRANHLHRFWTSSFTFMSLTFLTSKLVTIIHFIEML